MEPAGLLCSPSLHNARRQAGGCRVAEAAKSLVPSAALRAWGVAARLSATSTLGRSRQLSALLRLQVRLRLEIPGLRWE